MTPRLVCYRCGAEVIWIDFRGTPSPRCPEHPEQELFRGLGDGEKPPEPGPKPQKPEAQGELFR